MQSNFTVWNRNWSLPLSLGLRLRFQRRAQADQGIHASDEPAPVVVSTDRGESLLAPRNIDFRGNPQTLQRGAEPAVQAVDVDQDRAVVESPAASAAKDDPHTIEVVPLSTLPT